MLEISHTKRHTLPENEQLVHLKIRSLEKGKHLQSTHFFCVFPLPPQPFLLTIVQQKKTIVKMTFTKKKKLNMTVFPEIGSSPLRFSIPLEDENFFWGQVWPIFGGRPQGFDPQDHQ